MPTEPTVAAEEQSKSARVTAREDRGDTLDLTQCNLVTTLGKNDIFEKAILVDIGDSN